ncbi:MAG: F0F1 ATP synthase subunit B [Gammaproteobacteria bacterium]|nr:F0F1 ATP synthase subunit B [Gammaproteobacteria bacterium]
MNVTATLFGQMLTFAVLVWFIKGVLWEPMLKALEDRKKRIADGLAAAERGLHEKELSEKRAKDLLHEAKDQANEIINNAQKRAGEIVEEAKDQARAEGDKLKSAAKIEIEQEGNRVREDLRKQVAVLAVAGAEQILKQEVDAAKHNAMLEKLAAEL